MDNEDMKKSRVFVCVIICLCLSTGVCYAGATTASDTPVSLNVEDRPLGEVLAMITKATGHTFIIDDQLLDMPVSISAVATPLHKVLKSIFTELSNAIIYKSDGSIKILVYSEALEQDKESASQTTESSSESESSPPSEHEPESSPEAAPEAEPDNLADTAEEGGAPPDSEPESTDNRAENTAEGPSEEQGESPEEVSDSQTQ